MIFIWYTGYGWLTYLIAPLGLVAAVVVAFAVVPDGSGPPAMVTAFGVAFTVLTAPVQWLIGWRLNSHRTWSGREWHNQHTTNGAPIQSVSAVYVVVSLIFISIAVGQQTTALWGCLTLAGSLAAFWLLVTLARTLTRR